MTNSGLIRGLMVLGMLAASACDDVSINKCVGNLCGIDSDPWDFDTGVRDAATDAAKPDASLADGSVYASGIDGAVSPDAARDGAVTTPDATTTPGPVTAQSFCDTQLARAKAWQSFFDDKCQCLSPAEIEDRNYFLGAALLFSDQSTVGCLNQFDSLRMRSTITYDATKAAACGAKFAEQFAAPPAACERAGSPSTPGFDLDFYEGQVGHGVQPLAQLTECRAAFVGKVGVNGVCTDSFDCAGSLRCRPMPGAGADAGAGSLLCQTARAVNEDCTPGRAECETGLTCARTNSGNTTGYACIAINDLRLNGGACSTSRDCANALVCDCGSSGASCSSGVCKMLTPTPPAELTCKP
jgi:hypothetical protein